MEFAINIYYKSYDTQVLYYAYDSNFVNDNKMNINSQLVFENNEFIYRIIIPRIDNYSYYFSFKLFEKWI